MNMSREGKTTERNSSIYLWRWPIVVILFMLFALVAFINILRVPGKVIESTGKGAADIVGSFNEAAGKFRRGTITETFTASIPEFQNEKGGLLELAKVMVTETFKSQDELKYDFNWFELSAGTTTTEIRVPVTYRYHLRMRDPWRLDVVNGVCMVYAPEIRPSQPPALHTNRMEKSSDEGWARFNASEQMDDLLKTITPTIRKYASDDRRISSVRENCRKTVEEFVKSWLLREGQWGEGSFSIVKVYFPSDEGFVKPDFPKSLD
tara:strand:+ start:1056 stop:1847 length:792 start_codon:yes stop_codon:yes gene_type:complete